VDGLLYAIPHDPVGDDNRILTHAKLAEAKLTARYGNLAPVLVLDLCFS
jgi:hypothetical protein